MFLTFIHLVPTLFLSAAGLTLASPNKLEFQFVCQFHNLTSSLDIRNGFIDEQVKECLRTYSSAETLTFRQSKLKNIPDYLNILTGLVYLDLSHNDINHVAFNTSALTRVCKKLKHLNLDFNNIQSLHSGSLDCFESIEKLFLANNDLRIIENGTFNEKLSALNYIHLVNNSLTSLDSSLIYRVLLSEKVKITINASSNRIRAITNSVNITIEDVSPLIALRVILVHNNFTTVNIDYYFALFHVTNINKLYRLWNSGFDARFNPFICDCSMYQLALTLRKFQPIDKYNPVFSITCGSPVSLEGMMVRKVPVNQFNCSVTYNCPKACTCTKTVASNLITVVCSDKYQVHNLPRKCPESENIHLVIRSDYLTRISPGECLINATVLDVSQNSVTDVDPLIVDMLEGRAKRQIHLRENDLESIPTRFETFNFSEGQMLTIDGNPFNCDCNLRWMKKWLLSNTEYVPYQNKIMCESGPGKGKAVVDVPDNQFVCLTHLKITEILAIAGGSLFAFVLLLSFIVYNRNIIQVFMIHHFDVFRYCCRKKTHHHVRYDLFIPHSCDDDHIVWQIVHYLEGMDPPYKVCIGERNFKAGNTISVNILAAIESSQTSLLVISNNFLKSSWCNMEFRETHMRFLKDRNIRIVLILLEELDTDLLYEELKLYMNSHVYIKYTDGHFWAKLLQSLTVKIPNDNVGENSPLLEN